MLSLPVVSPHRVGLLFAAFAVALLLPGCGKGRKPTFPVTGQILVDDKPAPDAFIYLHPVEESEPEDTIRPFGKADEQGRFSLASYDAGDGAPAGEYIVTFEWRERSGLLKDQFGGPDRLGGKYYDPKSSKMRVEIKKEPNELPPFKLTSK